jgi:hypothetical protein
MWSPWSRGAERALRQPIPTSVALAFTLVVAPALAHAQDEELAPVEVPADDPGEAEGGATAAAADGGEHPGEAQAASESQGEAEAEEDKEEEKEDQEEEDGEDHKGFFFRFALGLGWAWLNGDGAMPPAKGLQLVEEPTYSSPVFNFSLDLGGGFLDLGLHLGVLYERMILRSDDPLEMGITLMGVGGGATYYFTDNDFYVTAQVRLVGLLMFMPGVICDRYFSDKFEWYRGPGFSVTLGKEWFGDDDGGIGLGIQGNYAYLMHSGGFAIHYGSLLLVLTLTHF